MKFRFEFDIKKLPRPIHHQHKLLLIGSCFTENITAKLRKAKFEVMENPHGILFNPVSVAGAIDDYIQKKVYCEADLFYLNEAWHSWQHHSRFSGLTVGEALQKINDSVSAAHDYLKQADYLFLTLGSAWLYLLTEKAPHHQQLKVAANNHKAPADWFTRSLSKTDDLKLLLTEMTGKLQAFNPDLKIIFTISPVRHLREGVIDNNRSKAVLIQAVHELVEEFEHFYYFPAYELVLDDLRDYRFYAEDLVHPNYFATEYVWEKFVEACISDGSRKIMAELYSIDLAYRHKPFHAASAQHKKFLDSFLERTKAVKDSYPFLDLEKEIAYFNGD